MSGSTKTRGEHPLQLVAYMGAVNEYYRDYGIEIAHALLVIAIPETASEVFWFETEAMNQYWQQWEPRVAEYWERRKWGW